MKYNFTIEEYTDKFQEAVVSCNGWYLRKPHVKGDGTFSTGLVQFESIVEYCKFISSL
jgi:hypothetical protein